MLSFGFSVCGKYAVAILMHLRLSSVRITTIFYLSGFNMKYGVVSDTNVKTLNLSYCVFVF